MTMNQMPKSSPLALAVLALLMEAPMHPYRMQQLLKERSKDEIINVRQRMSIYQTISRLLREGLIAVRETTREEKRPERTVYELTSEGRDAALTWMRQMLSSPAQEFPEFPVAISFLPILTPADALIQLERRAAKLTGEVARLKAELQSFSPDLSRLFLLETEYLCAMLNTELDWVRSIIDDLKAERLTWNEEWLRSVMEPPTPTESPPAKQEPPL